MSGEWLDSLNRLPKYVVSATLQEPKWTNATVLAGEVVSEVSKLKQQIQGEIVVYASRPLVRTLMEHDLVDELRLTVFPVAVGARRAPVRRDQRQATPAPNPHEDRGERPRPPNLRARPRGLNSRVGHLRDDRGRRSRRDDHPGILVAAPRKRGRRGSSEPPPTYAPTQPPGRGDGDRKRSRQVIDRLRLVLHRPGRQSSKGDRAAVCRYANGRERGRAAGSGRIGRGPDHHLIEIVPT